MKLTKNKCLFYLGSILLLSHFFIVALHLLSPNKYTAYYLNPFFTQSFNMFVPPPSEQYNLYVLEENKFVSDVFNDVLSKHQTNRLAGYEPLLLSISSSIFYFEKEALNQNFVSGQALSNNKFMMIEKIVRSYFKSEYKTEFKNLKLILIIKPLYANQQRVYYN